jgi:hypothetical protein
VNTSEKNARGKTKKEKCIKKKKGFLEVAIGMWHLHRMLPRPLFE